MIPSAIMRRLGSWLVGLFLISQIFGVVSLLSEHTAHVATTELLPSQVSASTGNIPQGRHHHGDADGFIQHHELQDLNGTLTCLSGQCEIAFTYVANTDYVPAALAEGDPILLERPPKPMVSG
jgi:hypothetical protein